MNRAFIIETASGLVIMGGCQDWQAGTFYDASIHTIVENDLFLFDPPRYDPDIDTTTAWYWDGSTFTQTAP